eukprot:Pgem_evm2s3
MNDDNHIAKLIFQFDYLQPENLYKENWYSNYINFGGNYTYSIILCKFFIFLIQHCQPNKRSEQVKLMEYWILENNFWEITLTLNTQRNVRELQYKIESQNAIAEIKLFKNKVDQLKSIGLIFADKHTEITKALTQLRNDKFHIYFILIHENLVINNGFLVVNGETVNKNMTKHIIDRFHRYFATPTEYRWGFCDIIPFRRAIVALPKGPLQNIVCLACCYFNKIIIPVDNDEINNAQLQYIIKDAEVDVIITLKASAITSLLSYKKQKIWKIKYNNTNDLFKIVDPNNKTINTNLFIKPITYIPTFIIKYSINDGGDIGKYVISQENVLAFMNNPQWMSLTDRDVWLCNTSVSDINHFNTFWLPVSKGGTVTFSEDFLDQVTCATIPVHDFIEKSLYSKDFLSRLNVLQITYSKQKALTH